MSYHARTSLLVHCVFSTRHRVPPYPSGFATSPVGGRRRDSNGKLVMGPSPLESRRFRRPLTTSSTRRSIMQKGASPKSGKYSWSGTGCSRKRS